MENYFNYFTEIEELFRKCRAEPVLLSPLDWALVESWKEQGFPLEAVLAGIERSFDKYMAGKRTYRKVNSLAYCSQEVFRAVEESRSTTAQGGAPPETKVPEESPFASNEIVSFLSRSAEAVEAASARSRQDASPVLAGELSEAATDLRGLAARFQAQPSSDLEETERVLTALEEKLNASLQRGTPVEKLAELRAEVDRGLAAYRRKMAAAEIDLLERRFLKTRLLEYYQIPRLSLFYL